MSPCITALPKCVLTKFQPFRPRNIARTASVLDPKNVKENGFLSYSETCLLYKNCLELISMTITSLLHIDCDLCSLSSVLQPLESEFLHTFTLLLLLSLKVEIKVDLRVLNVNMISLGHYTDLNTSLCQSSRHTTLFSSYKTSKCEYFLSLYDN